MAKKTFRFEIVFHGAEGDGDCNFLGIRYDGDDKTIALMPIVGELTMRRKEEISVCLSRLIGATLSPDPVSPSVDRGLSRREASLGPIADVVAASIDRRRDPPVLTSDDVGMFDVMFLPSVDGGPLFVGYSYNGVVMPIVPVYGELTDRRADEIVDKTRLLLEATTEMQLFSVEDSAIEPGSTVLRS